MPSTVSFSSTAQFLGNCMFYTAAFTNFEAFPVDTYIEIDGVPTGTFTIPPGEILTYVYSVLLPCGTYSIQPFEDSPDPGPYVDPSDLEMPCGDASEGITVVCCDEGVPFNSLSDLACAVSGDDSCCPCILVTVLGLVGCEEVTVENLVTGQFGVQIAGTEFDRIYQLCGPMACREYDVQVTIDPCL